MSGGSILFTGVGAISYNLDREIEIGIFHDSQRGILILARDDVVQLQRDLQSCLDFMDTEEARND